MAHVGIDGDRRAELRVFLASILSFIGVKLHINDVLLVMKASLPIDRDIIYLGITIAFCLALAVASRKAPSVIKPRLLEVFSCAAILAGGVLFVAAFSNADQLFFRVIADAGFALTIFGRVAVTVGLLVALCELGDFRITIACVALPFLTGGLVNQLELMIPWEWRVLLMAVLGAVSIVLTWGLFSRNIQTLQAGGFVDDLTLRQPLSFVAPVSLVFVNMLVFKVAFGFAIAWDPVGGSGESFDAWAQAGAAVVIAVWMLALGGVEGKCEDALLNVCIVLAFYGFSLAMISSLVRTGLVGSALISMGDVCSRILTTLAVVALGMRNPYQSVFLASLGRVYDVVGVSMGANLGHSANSLTAVGDDASAAVITAVTFLLFACYVVFALRGFSYVSLIHGTKPVGDLVPAELGILAGGEDVAGQNSAKTEGGRVFGNSGEQGHLSEMERLCAAVEAFDRSCEELARRAALTEREADVLLLLARGRDGRYIAEDLSISYNTARTHVKHVYSKLGVHSQQELIDLVS